MRGQAGLSLWAVVLTAGLALAAVVTSTAAAGSSALPMPHSSASPVILAEKNGAALPAAPGQSSEPPAEPSGYRMDAYRTPVPLTLSGAQVISGPEAIALWKSESAVFIDVYPRPPKPENLPKGTIWRDHPHQTIENAVWLPNVGYGRLAADVEAQFKRDLAELSGNNKSKALVFFCLRNCWMSWNAAKRAMTYGYENVIWFPDGTDAWQELGQLMIDAQPYRFKVDRH